MLCHNVGHPGSPAGIVIILHFYHPALQDQTWHVQSTASPAQISQKLGFSTSISTCAPRKTALPQMYELVLCSSDWHGRVCNQGSGHVGRLERVGEQSQHRGPFESGPEPCQAGEGPFQGREQEVRAPSPLLPCLRPAREQAARNSLRLLLWRRQIEA